MYPIMNDRTSEFKMRFMMLSQRRRLHSKLKAAGSGYRFRSWLVRTSLLVALLALAIGLASTALAQDTPPQPPAEANQISQDQVMQVARQLWCPLCSGVRLDSCELKACEQMREMIQIKLAEGQSTDEIKAYFVEQYGPQVLGEPPRKGFNLLAWILPFVAVIGGAIFVLFRIRRMIRAEPATVPDESNPLTGAAPQEPDAEYEKQLEEELKRYV